MQVSVRNVLDAESSRVRSGYCQRKPNRSGSLGGISVGEISLQLENH